jgi:hypothetical protein
MAVGWAVVSATFNYNSIQLGTLFTEQNILAPALMLLYAYLGWAE